MEHVMIDVEALRLNQPWIAPLMQVAAVRFDEKAEILGKYFNRFIDQETLPFWALPEESTLEFWQKQPFYPTLRDSCSLGTDPGTLLQELAGYIDGRIVWFAGPTYDQVMLEAYYDAYGVPRPWKYNDTRDFRTIRKQHPRIYDSVLENRTGEHDALCDALFQVEVLAEIAEVHQKIWR